MSEPFLRSQQKLSTAHVEMTELMAPRQGIEPWSIAWEASVLTTILPRITQLKETLTTHNLYKAIQKKQLRPRN